MKKLRGLFNVRGSERLNNSCYGNPRYLIYLKDSNGDNCKARTASNSAAGYAFAPGMSVIDCDYHFTTNGSMIIDYIYSR